MEHVISEYDAPTVEALDALLDSLNEYGFDRAATLLLTGKLKDFFATTPTTASFSGMLLEAARTAAVDISKSSARQNDVEDSVHKSETVIYDSDPDSDFSDTEDEEQDEL